VSDENAVADDWRNFPITRIRFFAGRTLGSVTPNEFRGLQGWLTRVREKWDAQDEDIKAHYNAIMQGIAHDAGQVRQVKLSVPPESPPSQTAHSTEAQRTVTGAPPTELLSTVEAVPVFRPPTTEQPAPFTDDLRAREDDSALTVEAWEEEEPKEVEAFSAEAPSLALAASEPDRRLIIFHHLCDEIRKATTLPEVLSLKADSERLGLESLIDQDKEAQRRYAKARLQAMQRAGEIIADLHKQAQIHDRAGKFTAAEIIDELEEDRSAIDGKSVEVQKSKTEILKQNGIPLRTANRYEQLAGPPQPEIREAVQKASEQYFSDRLENKKMPKADELLKVVEAISGIQSKPKVISVKRRARAFLRWMRNLRDKTEEYDGALFADYAEQSDEKTFVAVKDFYRKFYARFRERFPTPPAKEPKS
jgi:hypothetical protein